MGEIRVKGSAEARSRTVSRKLGAILTAAGHCIRTATEGVPQLDVITRLRGGVAKAINLF